MNKCLVALLLAALSTVGWAAAGSSPVRDATTARVLPQAASSHSQGGSQDSKASAERAFVRRYCIGCHNEKTKAGGLLLDGIDVDRVADHEDVWEKVVKKLRAGVMPPVQATRPPKEVLAQFVSSLESSLEQAAVANPNPGRLLAHRLNRSEYANAIHDILSLDIDLQLLPADGESYGFDNIADVLSVSPQLFKRYVSVARKIGRLVVGDPDIRATTETYTVPKLMRQDERAGEDAPLGTRGGLVVQHYFPLDGDYMFKIALQRTLRESVRGMQNLHHLDLRIDGDLVQRFEIGGLSKGAGNAAMTADADLVVRAPVQAGRRTIAVTFASRTLAMAEGVGLAKLPLRSFAFYADEESDPGVDALQIEGPNSARRPEAAEVRRRLFVCYPKVPAEEASCASQILSTIAGRAYRRPVTSADLKVLLAFYRQGRPRGFDAGIEFAVERVLVDPDFLFRFERNPPGATPGRAYRISDVELASRLSFFLWSSVPDDELLRVAIDGRLKDPATLERQVRRMLQDGRSRALMQNFGGQWLQLRNLKSKSPDPISYPEFDDDLKQAFQTETEMFLQYQMQADTSVLDLLAANYTFVNERLADHYGIPNVLGSHFRRVDLSENLERGGLLGQGSILTLTSYANRTSPVLRAKWVLSNLLSTPPPVPPPDVPSIEDRPDDGKVRSMRQRMEVHRSNPVCASCHAHMDPLGFALERYDAIGRRRTEGSIDTSAVLPDGTKFEGMNGLRDALLSRPSDFVGGVGQKLLVYALGRGPEPQDASAVRKIVRESAGAGYRWSSVIMGIVTSAPFQMRLAADSQTVSSAPASPLPEKVQ